MVLSMDNLGLGRLCLGQPSTVTLLIGFLHSQSVYLLCYFDQAMWLDDRYDCIYALIQSFSTITSVW